MFSIYARRYNPKPSDGFPSPGTDEVLLFTIPTQDGNPRPFLTAVVNNEMGNSGSFEFSFDCKSKFYNLFIPIRTFMRVEYDGETIFYGRVLTVDTDMHMTTKIHCEGCQTFLMDSLFEGKKDGYTVTLDEYLDMLLDAHNTCMANSPEKKIFAGEIPGHYSQSINKEQKVVIDRQKFGTGQGYKTVKEWLDEIVADYAGQLRVRYNNTDGKMYLDWLKTYFNPALNDQTMAINRNTIDWGHVVEVNNIFTYVLPIGKDNKYLDGGKKGEVQPGTGHTDLYYYVRCVKIIPSGTSGEPGNVWATPHAVLKTEPAGTHITLHCETFAGFVLEKIEVFGSQVSPIHLVGGNSFPMPQHDVTVNFYFSKLNDQGGLDPAEPPIAL